MQTRCARSAHEVGALVSLDAYHSVGIIPVDVQALGADFLTGGVLKWLCGGPGAAFLYAVTARARPARAGTHRLAGARAPFRVRGRDGVRDRRGALAHRYTVDSRRCTPRPRDRRSCSEAGIDAIRAKSLRQTEWLIRAADERGYRVHAPRDPSVRGGTVAMDVPHAREVAQYLLAEDIVIDYRVGAGIRVAPHFYTRDDELETFVRAVDECLATGAWKRFEEPARAAVVT